MQTRLSNLLAEVNTTLAHQNRSIQILLDIGGIFAPHFFMHQDIEKQIIRKTNSKRKFIREYQKKKLVDGVLDSEEVSQVWFNALHANYFKVYPAVKNYLDKKKWNNDASCLQYPRQQASWVLLLSVDICNGN